MFRCVACPTAFCAECNGETPFDAVEANAEWESLGFYLPKSFEYVRCGDCCAKREEEAGKTKGPKGDGGAEEQTKGGGGSAKKQRRR
jgi:SWI/SNF-related matrix-associated actin-dependent regulator of chromatin subfamily A member 5